jgi:hypothetical protein
MFGLHLGIILDAFCTLGAAFALWKGGTAERGVAIVIIINMLISEIGGALAPANEDLILFVDDGLTALAVLAITIRYSALWMGAIMLLYATQFSMHSFYFVTERPRDAIYAIVNDVDFNAIVWCLVIGTVVAWRKRLRLAREAAALPAAP